MARALILPSAMLLSLSGCALAQEPRPLGSPAAMPAQIQQQCLGFEKDAADTDMAGTLLAAHWAPSSDDCCALCYEVVRCEGFAFAGDTCYLKTNFSGTFHKDGVTTRVKRTSTDACGKFGAVLQDRDLAGNLLEDWFAPSSESCCKVCGQKPECQGFVFFDSRCYLKGKVEGTFAQAGRIAHIKMTVAPAPSPAPTEAPALTPMPTPDPQVETTCSGFESEMADTDMAGALIAVRWAAGSSDCCTFCEETEDCEGFAFSLEACYLKKEFCGTYPKFGVNTRLKTPSQGSCDEVFQPAQADSDLVGDLLEDWSAPKAELCCTACGQKASCQGFVFFENRCYLKGNVGGTFSKVGRLTRVKKEAATVPATAVPTPTPTLTPVQPEQCSNFEDEGIDMDMAGSLIGKQQVPSSDACCTLCDVQDGCEGFAFAEDTCYLKNNFSGTFNKVGVTSRLKRMRSDVNACGRFGAVLQDRDLAGNLLEDWFAPSSEFCCKVCGQKPECQGFVFFDSRCYLKGKVEGTFAQVGRIARMKTEAPAPTPMPTPTPPTGSNRRLREVQ